jgi:DNA-binding transcriptional ArsR family regulator
VSAFWPVSVEYVVRRTVYVQADNEYDARRFARHATRWQATEEPEEKLDTIRVGDATTVDWRAVARAALHHTQIAVLDLLAATDGTPRTPTELSEALGGEPLTSVSYHVKALADRGLLKLVRTERHRGGLQHFYRLAEEARA